MFKRALLLRISHYMFRLLIKPSSGVPNIEYCLIWDSLNLEDQVPAFISPRNRVAQLYPRALG
jgi:hypothetical protein